jgi:hypothetical protein
MISMVEPIRLLSEEGAREMVARLDSVRSDWVLRDDARAFATLGRAAYMDLCGGRATVEEYRALAAPQNAVLSRHFGDLHELARAAVEKAMGLPAMLTDRWALPGFHIFTGPGLQGAGSGGAHFDLQYRELVGDLPRREREELRPVSLTLALELPAAGSGLRVWPIRPSQLDAAGRAKGRRETDERLGEYLRRKPSAYFPYEPGVLYFQPEPLLHCIFNAGTVEEVDRRITLQGHGIVQEGRVVLYW